MTRKTLFDTFRSMLGRGFNQSEVDLIDDAIDRAIARRMPSDTASPLETGQEISSQDSVPSVPSRRIGVAGIALIKRFEGCARQRRDGLVEAYPDPGTGGDPWTIGWGATGASDSGMIGPGTVWTQQQCDDRLEADLARYAADVAHALGDAPASPAQFDALVSFHYNTGAIARATLTKRHKAGDFIGAANEFHRWNRAGGRVMKGLVRRRAAEARLYAS